MVSITPLVLAKNIVVPKSDHLPPSLFERRRSAHVRWIVGMLTAIEFDHQCVFGASEVDDEIADRMLAPELVPR